MYIYVAGPLTLGHRPENIHNALKAGERIKNRGHIPFVPHLFELWDIVSPQHYEFWMEMDLKWLEKCDALVRLPGESLGADREVNRAFELGIPIFYGIEDLMNSALWDTGK